MYTAESTYRESVHHQPAWKLQYSPMALRIQRYRPPASGTIDPSSDATNAIGTLQRNGRMRIINSVMPGPDDETTSSIPNEPEQVSVNTKTTAVISRILTRFRPSLRNSSVIRTPPMKIVHPSSQRLRCKLPQIDPELVVLSVVNRNVYHNRAPAIEGFVHYRAEIAGTVDAHAVHAERARQADQIRVLEARTGNAAELAALVHLDEAIAAVSPDEDDEGQSEPFGGLELLHVHQEAAIAGDAHNLASAAAHQSGGDGRRKPEAHGGEAVAHENGIGLTRLPEARHPQLVSAHVRDQDVVWRQGGAQVAQHALGLDRQVVVRPRVEQRRKGPPVRLGLGMRDLLALEKPGELIEDAAEITDELHLGHVVSVDLRGHRVDADDSLTPVGVPGRRRPLDHVVADADHEVRAPHESLRVVLGAQAGGEQELVGGGVDDALAHERGDDVQSGLFAERAQGMRRPLAHDAIADEHHRALRGLQRLDGAQQAHWIGLGERLGAGLHGPANDARPHDVGRELQVRGPRLLGGGRAEGLAHRLADHARIVDTRVPLGHRAQDLDRIDELVRLFVHAGEADLPGERH